MIENEGILQTLIEAASSLQLAATNYDSQGFHGSAQLFREQADEILALVVRMRGER